MRKINEGPAAESQPVLSVREIAPDTRAARTTVYGYPGAR